MREKRKRTVNEWQQESKAHTAQARLREGGGMDGTGERKSMREVSECVGLPHKEEIEE